MKLSKFVLAATVCATPFPSIAQGIDPDASEAAARAALSALGVAATPNEALPTLSFLRASGTGADFRSYQLKGGFLLENRKLFVEGLVAYQNYNPQVVFPDIAPGVQLNVTWESVAATFGLGWEFSLADNWKLRPLGHLSIGNVASGAKFDGFPLSAEAARAARAVDGNLDALGVGASLSLTRQGALGPWNTEYRLRHTFLDFQPIDSPTAGNAKASSNQTNLYARFTHPINSIRLFDTPTRLVLDAGTVLYHGDSAAVLGTDWLASVGVGLEIDTERFNAPLIKKARVMLKAIAAEEYDGFSFGVGIGF